MTPLAEHPHDSGIARPGLKRQQLVRGGDGLDCGAAHRGTPGSGILWSDFVSGVHVLTSWPGIVIIAV
jgi:hypothetical protein